MSEFTEDMRKAVDDMAQATIKGITAIGTEADKLVENLHKRIDQYERDRRLRELYAELGRKVHAIVKDGKHHPDDPAIAELIEKIDSMR